MVHTPIPTPNADTIGDDDPVTLAEACRLFFGGRLSPSALRTEAAKGNLEIMQIARKDFVTRKAIRAMMVACTRPSTKPEPARPARPITAQEALRLKLLRRSAADSASGR